MGTVRTSSNPALGYYEPELTTTFLPRCGGCGSPHPLARKPKITTGVCPDCGTNAPVGQTKTVKSTLTGFAPWTLLARLLLWLGKLLTLLARKI